MLINSKSRETPNGIPLLMTKFFLLTYVILSYHNSHRRKTAMHPLCLLKHVFLNEVLNLCRWPLLYYLAIVQNIVTF